MCFRFKAFVSAFEVRITENSISYYYYYWPPSSPSAFINWAKFHHSVYMADEAMNQLKIRKVKCVCGGGGGGSITYSVYDWLYAA